MPAATEPLRHTCWEDDPKCLACSAQKARNLTTSELQVILEALKDARIFIDPHSSTGASIASKKVNAALRVLE